MALSQMAEDSIEGGSFLECQVIHVDFPAIGRTHMSAVLNRELCGSIHMSAVLNRELPKPHVGY